MKILKNASGIVSKGSFKLKQHSPEILLVAGVIGTIVSGVAACKATIKAQKIIKNAKDDLKLIDDCANKNGPFEGLEENYSVEDGKKDTQIVYIQAGMNLLKVYAPAIIIGTLSIANILASNHILRRRNAALTAAYMAIDKGFKKYRSRVIDRFGDKVDRELRHNIKAKEVQETVVDEEGNEKTVTRNIEVIESDAPSEFARFFDEGSRCWEKNPEYNLSFLVRQQQYANDLLRANGHLFLNEVYDMLDLPRSRAGQIVGWVYNPDSDISDNYVDFGIHDQLCKPRKYREKARDFVNGYERVILLDFNVDGPILDLIDKKE